MKTEQKALFNNVAISFLSETTVPQVFFQQFNSNSGFSFVSNVRVKWFSAPYLESFFSKDLFALRTAFLACFSAALNLSKLLFVRLFLYAFHNCNFLRISLRTFLSHPGGFIFVSPSDFRDK